jgi:hypothetical protein
MAPTGSLPDGYIFLASLMMSLFSLCFLSIRLNLAIVNTLALILLILALSCSDFSAFIPSMILPNSSFVADYEVVICSFDNIAFFLSK